MKSKLNIIILVVVLLIIAGSLIFNDYGFITKAKINSQIDSLRSEIEFSKKKIETLNAEIDSLKNSKAKIEHVAREKYNFKKPNETVIDIETQ